MFSVFWLRIRDFLFELEVCFIGFSFFYHIILDLFSIVFLRFIFLISIVVVFYRWFYIGGDINLTRFLIIVLLFVGSMGVLTLSPSPLGIILGWDGLGVTSFLLVIFYNNVSSLRSGLITVYTNRLGDVFILFRFFFIFSFGCFIRDFFLIYALFIFSFLVLLAGITKRAQIPFSSWLPAAISAPTPVSSLVHSSTLVTAGVYLFIRFYYMISFFTLRFFFILLRLLTSFSAGIIAWLEVDLKKLVAMSTLSQLGILIYCISISQILFTFFHMVSHALFKSLLFLCCGFIILIGLGNQDIRFMGNKFVLGKTPYFMLLLSAFRLCGFPFLAGFFSKDLIIDFLLNESILSYFLLFFILSCLFSLFYRFKFMGLGLIQHQIGFNSIFSFSSFFINLFLGILFFWSISLGKILLYLVVDGELFISFFLKKILGILFFFICMLYLFNWFYSINFKKTYAYMFVEMLNINWYFGKGFTKNLFSTYVLLVGEYYWLEIYGAKGLNLVLIYFKESFFINFKFLTIRFLLLLISFFLIILLFSLFKSVVLKRQRIQVKQNFFFSFVLPQHWKCFLTLKLLYIFIL